jgi:hypothetical protein
MVFKNYEKKPRDGVQEIYIKYLKLVTMPIIFLKFEFSFSKMKISNKKLNHDKIF